MNGFDLLMTAARLEDARFKPGDKAVLCAIASYFNGDACCAFPTLEQVQARACYRDRNTLISAIRRVEKLGFLEIERRNGCGNRYRLNLPDTNGENPYRLGNPQPVGENMTATGWEKPNGAVGKTPTEKTNINTKGKTNDAECATAAQNAAVTPPPPPPVPDDDPDAFSLSPEPAEALPARNGIPPCPAQKMVDVFNARCGSGMRTVRILSPSRQSALAARWRFIWRDCECRTAAECLEAWSKFCNRVAASDFLMNRTPRPFRGGLDRIITQQFFTNIIEGKYDD